jgi:hypothetical protein
LYCAGPPTHELRFDDTCDSGTARERALDRLTGARRRRDLTGG